MCFRVVTRIGATPLLTLAENYHRAMLPCCHVAMRHAEHHVYRVRALTGKDDKLRPTGWYQGHGVSVGSNQQRQFFSDAYLEWILRAAKG